MRSDAFRQAVSDGDPAAMAAALAPDVTFRSPVVYKAYEGRDATLAVLDAVSRVFEHLEYLDAVEGIDSAALIFRARIGDRELEGLDHLSFDSEGQITELRVMVRPMSGMQALAEAMRAELERVAAASSAGDG